METTDFKDRKPTYPGRKKLTILSQTANSMMVDVEYADEPIHEGTPINAEVMTKFQQGIIDANTNSENAITTANIAKSNSENAVTTSNTANINSENAVIVANESKDIAQNSNEKSDIAISTANASDAKSDNAVITANTANTKSDSATSVANTALSKSSTALTNSENALLNSQTALTNSDNALEKAETALTNSKQAVEDSTYAKNKADEVESKLADRGATIKVGESTVTEVKFTSEPQTQIDNIKNNSTVIANSNGGFSCGVNATHGTGLQFRDYTVCDENGKIPVARLVDAIYPIGSIYMSVNSTSPATLFGGNWEAIQDKFLLSAGSTYPAGTLGGEASHVLNEAEMPKHHHNNYIAVSAYQNSHSHGLQSSDNYSTNCNGLARSGTATSGGMHQVGGVANNNGGTYYCYTAGNGNSYVEYTAPQITVNSGITNVDAGSGQAHNNMPPYLAVYMWKRIG